ncbi:MAG: efflux transporter, family, subunit [Vampirovibrio sp.]|jgi:multidrug efflux system membrane fusion protein|nr:efflux transporter, family, subunit [Vampirovibrio sp.]
MTRLSPAVDSSKKSFSPLRLGFFIGITVLLIAIFLLTRPADQAGMAGKGGKGKMANMPVPVVLGTVSVKSMPVQLRTIGNVESVSSVTIRPQIDGQITNIYFHEGAMVSKGQLLFTIDSQPVRASLAQAQAVVSKDQSLVAQAEANLVRDQAQVKQAKANLERDRAQLHYAQAQEKRFLDLLEQEFISRDQYEQAVATRRAAEATVQADRSEIQNAQALVRADYSAIESAKANVKADQAVVDSYRIRLNYASIRSPINGRTGSLKVHIGDTVKTNDTIMVSVDQINPIYVGFSIPEQSLKSVKFRAGEKNLPVTIKTREMPPTLMTGRVNFLENTVDTTTGTIRLKALFQNNNRLWPGQFVDVMLNLANEPNVVVIPLQAIQSGQQGDYVYVAQDNMTAQMRPVVVDRIVENLAVIRSGLQPGERIVTDGQFQLTPGSPIKVKS